jgi:hypothetical protein
LLDGDELCGVVLCELLESVLLLPVLPVLLLPLEPPGVSAPPVAELPPPSPKCEKMLWRQLGWLRSVLASNVGADCNLLVSPANVKVGACCEPLVLVLLEVAELEAPADEARKSIQGTATCLPFPNEEAGEAVVPGLVEVAPLDDVELPALLVADSADRLITANSRRPEAGFMTVSLIVPIGVPEEPVTCAPVS